MYICEGRLKFFVAFLALSLTCTAVQPRHIRSVDDVTTPPPTPPTPLDNTTVPLPPPDGGAKTILEPEVGAGDILTEPETVAEPEAATETLPEVVVSNETKPVPKAEPEGRAGFGGPPAPTVGDVVEVVEVGESGTDGPGGEGELLGGPVKELDSCRVCPPGYGVVSPCTATSDTVCKPCPAGTFSEGYSATSSCVPCSSCPSGHYRRTPCVADSDVRCGACHSRGNGYGNEDFLKECEGHTMTPAPATGSGDDGAPEVSTLEPGLLPVKTAPPKVDIIRLGTEEDPDEQKPGPIGEPQMGEAKDDKLDKKEPSGGGFQWPVLVAGIVSALVFFVVGILVSMMCKKSAHEKKHKQLEEDFGEDSVRSSMIRRTNNDFSPSHGSNGYRGSNANSPLNPGNK